MLRTHEYVYDLGTNTPTVPVTVLTNPNKAENRFYAWAVEVSGNRVVVTTPFGRFGDFYNGKAYIYDLASATPALPVATLRAPDLSGKAFGWNVKLSGSRIVIAAPQQSHGGGYAGNVYVYDFTNGTSALPLATLSNPDPENADGFAISLGISGTRVAVGAFQDNTITTRAGAAYVYDLTSSSPNAPAFALQDTGPSKSDSFGYSVAVSGTLMVVGAPFERRGPVAAGSAYVYDLASAMPLVPAFILNNPSQDDDSAFGNAVALSGKRVVVGSWLDGGGSSARGALMCMISAGARRLRPL